MTEDLISVIIPVYKVEKYLDECLASVTGQTYRNLEIILVDDGSPDRCGEICDQWANKDNRIRVIHKQNGGLADARNAGIDVATGDYISFVDSDDYVDEDFLEGLYSALKKFNTKLAICNMTTFDENGKTDEKFCQPFTSMTLAEGKEKYESLLRHCAPNKLYKREIFDNIRYPKGKLYEDLYVYHLILDKVDKVAYTGKNSYHYRTRSDSIMNTKYTLNSTDIVRGYYNRAKFYDEKKEYRLADDAYLWVYSRTAVAFSHLDKSVKENAEKLKEVKELYNSSAFRMILHSSFSLKQRLRCLILFISPTLHEKLYHYAQVNN